MKWLVISQLLAMLTIPLLTLFSLNHVPAMKELPARIQGGSSFPAASSEWLRETVGPTAVGLPRITNVQVVDLNGDRQNEVLVCDASRNQVLAYELSEQGEWQERVIADQISAPAHATVVDLDLDGDLDVVVSVLGNILPDDGVVGSVVWLENHTNGYIPHTILDNVRRVADVQPADFDADGDIDLTVAVFGYNRGQVLWLENRGAERFREHELLARPGTIHVPVADYDGDGDPDIAAIVSQDEEELWVFENLGAGSFQSRMLHRFFNFDIGSAGLVQTDLDRDGDVDLLLPVGDNLEDANAYPQPYHGCFWFENQGEWVFEAKRISDLGGTYAASACDLDSDEDLDVVLVSMSNDWRTENPASVVCLENDGRQNFSPRQIDSEPSHLVTVDCGDVNGDGLPDIVAGGLHIRSPYSRIGRVAAWLNLRESER
ncbi:MAG: VCBS repeat-containing protein [Planctomycetaceae bacterium]|nr:VCBS repeat-containing protein [Planctomycetaceae bacterium]